MGNFEKLSVLVIVVIIVMILVVALYQLTDDPDGGAATTVVAEKPADVSPAPPEPAMSSVFVPPPRAPELRNTPAAPPSPAPRPNLLDPVDPSRSLQPQSGGATPGTEPSTPPTEPVKPAEPKVHVVQPGETIGKIAKAYFPSAVAKGTDAILRANATVDPTRMRVGTKLVIPDLGAELTPASAPGTSANVTPASSRPTTSLKPGGVYVTVRGDTLSSISRRAYGTAARWQDIWLANFDALPENPDHPTPGTRLNLPR